MVLHLLFEVYFTAADDALDKFGVRLNQRLHSNHIGRIETYLGILAQGFTYVISQVSLFEFFMLLAILNEAREHHR